MYTHRNSCLLLYLILSIVSLSRCHAPSTLLQSVIGVERTNGTKVSECARQCACGYPLDREFLSMYSSVIAFDTNIQYRSRHVVLDLKALNLLSPGNLIFCAVWIVLVK